VTDFDVAVIGLGIMGSAIVNELAARGQLVIGIDRHEIPHAAGSSHGGSRVIREAYFEHPMYVPLVRRAFERWRELERESPGEPLMAVTGSLMIGEASSEVVRGTLRSAVEYGITHEVLESDTLHRRFPAFTPLEEMVGVYEPGSGILFPEPILRALLSLAAGRGATLMPNVTAMGLGSGDAGITVTTDAEPIRAGQVVLCAGAWLPVLMPSLDLRVERQVMHWFESDRYDGRVTPDRMPVSLWQLRDGSMFYTVPDFGAGVKVGWHHGGRLTTADTVDRQVANEEWAVVADLLRRFAPSAKGPRGASSVCLYTNTSDGHFLLDVSPEDPRIHIVSACSGHGFKFAPAIAELVADAVGGVPPALDLSPFRLARLQQASA
jgi:sarcosine oxidase